MKRRDFIAAASAATLCHASWAQDAFPARPVKLIVPMLERFMATDRGFARSRKPRS